MKRIDVRVANQEFTFRTNNNGNYLFTGVSENRQISCESNFDSLHKIKATIREYLKNKLGYSDKKMPRIQYVPSKCDMWKA